jgi:hypothetical protein
MKLNYKLRVYVDGYELTEQTFNSEDKALEAKKVLLEVVQNANSEKQVKFRLFIESIETYKTSLEYLKMDILDELKYSTNANIKRKMGVKNEL